MKKLVKIITYAIVSAFLFIMLAPSIYAEEPNVTVDAEILPVYNGASGIVTMTFDDGYYESALIINELCEIYDLEATLMMIASKIQNVDKWNELFEKGYLDPQNHSMSHIGLRETDTENLNNETYKSEILDSKDILEDYFPNSDMITYAIPFGGWCDDAATVGIGEYFMIRGTRTGKQTLDPGFNLNEPGSWSNLYSPYIAKKEGVDQLEHIKSLVDGAKEGSWLCTIAHRVGDVEGTEIPYDVLNQTFAYVSEAKKNGEVWVTTTQDATKYIRERQNTTITVTEENGSIYIKADMQDYTEDGLYLDKNIFNHPLTVKVSLPDCYESVFYLNGCIEESAEIVRDGNKTYAYLNIVPNGEKIELFNTQIDKSTLEHDYESATCENPMTCRNCFYQTGNTLPHDFYDATCTLPKRCKNCGASEGEANGHDYRDSTCLEPQTCNNCGKTKGSKGDHEFSDATCETPKICKHCNKSSGEALGHSFEKATCNSPMICTVCKKVSGDKLPHNFTEASCIKPKTCLACGFTEGDTVNHSVGDSYIKNEISHWQICTVCSEKINAEGHSYTDGKCTTCGNENLTIANGESNEFPIVLIIVIVAAVAISVGAVVFIVIKTIKKNKAK